MKKITIGLMVASLLCLLSTGILAQEKDLKEHFTFGDDLLVNTTLVKKGTYLIRYSAENGEMSIMDGDRVVARAKATVTTNDKKFAQDALLTTTTPMGKKLLGLRLGGQHEEITINDNVVDTGEN
jgi:predicted Co/Zn/Cd cation transporter (cation efflux family)